MPKRTAAKRRATSSPKPVKRLTADALVPVDATLKAAWEKADRRLTELSKDEAKDFDALWETVAKVLDHDPPLYLFGGFRNAKEFFQQRLHVDPRTATRNLRVARYASPEDEAKFGSGKIDAALSYLEAKHGPLEGTLPVAFDRLRIPDAEGKGIRFADLTQAQIQSATRALIKKSARAPKNPTRAAIEGALAKHDAFARVVVHERSGLATFANVPLASLGLFGRTLASTKLPPAKG